MLSDYTFQVILVGTIVLGFTVGSVGVFSVLRKQALIGDTLSHASLPGVVIAFIIFNTKSIEVLLLGAVFASFVAMGLLALIKKYSKIKFDAGMALILSSFFGFGNVLLNSITGASQAGLNSFIFGQAATMLRRDVLIIVVISIVVLLVTGFFWRHFKLYIFNAEFYNTLGFKGSVINFILTFITVVVVVISIRTVGVILMSALLVIPAVTARLLSNKLIINFFLSGTIGAISGVGGSILSYQIEDMPTGPAIVIILGIFIFITIFFSPKKGLIGNRVRNWKYKKIILEYHNLIHIYEGNSSNDVKPSELVNLVESGYLIMEETGEHIITKTGEEKVIDIMRGENIWG